MTQTMSIIQIKSQDAKDYLHGTTNEKEFRDLTDLLPLSDALKAISIAEAEAEQRHKKHIEKIIHIYDCDMYHAEHNHSIGLQELKNKSAEAFCFSVNIGFNCKKNCPTNKCKGYINFTNELNK